MDNKLSEKCATCASWTWCGRDCGRKPVEVPNHVHEPIDGDPGLSTTYEYRDPEARRAYQRKYQRERRKRKAEERAAAREKKRG